MEAQRPLVHTPLHFLGGTDEAHEVDRLGTAAPYCSLTRWQVMQLTPSREIWLRAQSGVSERRTWGKRITTMKSFVMP
jgi:hypothetical protein